MGQAAAERTLEFAKTQDQADPLRRFRDEFFVPLDSRNEPVIYLAGNSLGLSPRTTPEVVGQELASWQARAVRGHFEGDFPWMRYHEFVRDSMARLVGAQPSEVVAMNSLTVNLHLMLATFYRPTATRHQILVEEHAFPSDIHAVSSQIRWHGRDPETSLLTVRSRGEATTLSWDDIAEAIESNHRSLSLILLPGVQYYTGQAFPMKRIVELAHRRGIAVGFDLAHAVGNLELALHDWQADFAVWCTYKYLNSGPGAVAGCFVHERHARDIGLGRLAGWWGHDKTTRFEMKPGFRAMPTAEGWQISNPPILSLAPLRCALELFEQAGGMAPLRQKSLRLTGYLEQLIRCELGERVRIITPAREEERGCQLSLEIAASPDKAREIHRRLLASNVEADWREPSVIRAAPVPLYNSFEDAFRFVQILKQLIETDG